MSQRWAVLRGCGTSAIHSQAEHRPFFVQEKFSATFIQKIQFIYPTGDQTLKFYFAHFLYFLSFFIQEKSSACKGNFRYQSSENRCVVDGSVAQSLFFQKFHKNFKHLMWRMNEIHKSTIHKSKIEIKIKTHISHYFAVLDKQHLYYFIQYQAKIATN